MEPNSPSLIRNFNIERNPSIKYNNNRFIDNNTYLQNANIISLRNELYKIEQNKDL